MSNNNGTAYREEVQTLPDFSQHKKTHSKIMINLWKKYNNTPPLDCASIGRRLSGYQHQVPGGPHV